MSATLLAPASAARTGLAVRRVAPIWRATEGAPSLVARPAMARDEVSATAAAAGAERPRGAALSMVRVAAIAAGAAFAGSTVGLAFFLSRRPTGSPGDHYVKFRA